MLGIDVATLTSGPKPDDLELVECHEDWSHTGTPQWACSEDGPREDETTSSAPQPCQSHQGLQQLWHWCSPCGHSTAREPRPLPRGHPLDPIEIGGVRGGATLGCQTGAAAALWRLAQSRRFTAFGHPDAPQVPAAAHPHQPASEGEVGGRRPGGGLRPEPRAGLQRRPPGTAAWLRVNVSCTRLHRCTASCTKGSAPFGYLVDYLHTGLPLCLPDIFIPHPPSSPSINFASSDFGKRPPDSVECGKTC